MKIGKKRMLAEISQQELIPPLYPALSAHDSLKLTLPSLTEATDNIFMNNGLDLLSPQTKP